MAGARGPEGGSDSRSPDSSPRHCGGRGIRGPDREESDKGSLHMEMMERCHCNSTVGSSEANNGKMLSPLAQHLTRCLSLQERRKLGHPQQRGQQCPQEQAVSRSQLSSPVQGPPSSGVFTPTGATPSLLQVPSRMMEVSPAGSEPSRLSSPHLMGPPSGPSSPLPSPSPCAFADSADQDVSGEGLAEHHEDQRLSRVLSGVRFWRVSRFSVSVLCAPSDFVVLSLFCRRHTLLSLICCLMFPLHDPILSTPRPHQRTPSPMHPPSGPLVLAAQARREGQACARACPV